jgi:hypothetical protein
MWRTLFPASTKEVLTRSPMPCIELYQALLRPRYIPTDCLTTQDHSLRGRSLYTDTHWPNQLERCVTLWTYHTRKQMCHKVTMRTELVLSSLADLSVKRADDRSHLVHSTIIASLLREGARRSLDCPTQRLAWRRHTKADHAIHYSKEDIYSIPTC